MDQDIDVRDIPEENRFRISVGGVDAGGAYYRQRDDTIVFTHTEIDDAYSGRGIGSRLAQTALDTVRSRGQRTAPLCTFIAAYIERHDEYSGLVDQELTESLRRSR